MKLAIRLTMDGLIRALRTRAHDIADAREMRHSARVVADRTNRKAPPSPSAPHGRGQAGGADGRSGA